jgi:hypothetical protein
MAESTSTTLRPELNPQLRLLQPPLVVGEPFGKLMNQSQNSALSYGPDAGVSFNNEFWDGFMFNVCLSEN